VLTSLKKLKTYCESQNFSGWDPYDGLKSKVFQVTPLKHLDFVRLAWIQWFKRSPINFRKLLIVPKEHNAKSLGLFLTGYCNIYKAQQLNAREDLGENGEILNKINYLANLIISLQSKGYSGACWGYNFDWQSKAFFLPRNTPTVVVTSFIVEALLNAYEITGKEKFKAIALSSADFILKDLNRIEKPNGFMFSYSPLDNQAVYNASLLGSKSLVLINKYCASKKLLTAASLTAQAVCDTQNPDGSFPHSDQVGNKWRDNFHTGFKLESLSLYQKYCNDNKFSEYVEKGFKYWIENFFDHKTGRALYYDKDGSLVDLHCAGQAISTFYKLHKLNEYSILTKKIVKWTIENMQAKDGSFYFQKDGNRTNKIRYMRWPNAWMFYGLSYFFLNNAEYTNENEKH
jgi:hypothetical protein